MKIRYAENAKPQVDKPGRDIEIGTVFSGRIGSINSIFLKTFDGIVDLEDPRNTWNESPIPTFPDTVVSGCEERNAELVIS